LSFGGPNPNDLNNFLYTSFCISVMIAKGLPVCPFSHYLIHATSSADPDQFSANIPGENRGGIKTVIPNIREVVGNNHL